MASDMSDLSSVKKQFGEVPADDDKLLRKTLVLIHPNVKTELTSFSKPCLDPQIEDLTISSKTRTRARNISKNLRSQASSHSFARENTHRIRALATADAVTRQTYTAVTQTLNPV
jgi:hypothetical protein